MGREGEGFSRSGYARPEGEVQFRMLEDSRTNNGVSRGHIPRSHAVVFKQSEPGRCTKANISLRLEATIPLPVPFLILISFLMLTFLRFVGGLDEGAVVPSRQRFGEKRYQGQVQLCQRPRE
jgi:hypothetical protein